MANNKMHAILKGLLVSDKPEAIKSAFVKKIKDSASQAQTSDEVKGIFETTSTFILNEQSPFVIASCKEVYTAWARLNTENLEQFWTVNYVHYLLEGKFPNGPEALWLMHQSFRYLQLTRRFGQLCQAVESKSVMFVRENPAVDMIVAFCSLLKEFKRCLPKGEPLAHFCVAIIHASTTFQAPTNKDLSSYVKNVTGLGKFLANIWQSADLECVMQCLRAIFKVISTVHENGLQPSHALGAIASNIPTDYIPAVIRAMVTDTSIPDVQITAALNRMIDWLSWPLARNIDHWVIALLNGLASVKKYTILIQVTEAKIEQVYEKTGFPIVRDSAMNVLSHMLLSYQCSAQPFHKICGKVPATVEQLKGENTPESLKSLHQLAELMHCLIALHPGFPELYDPILDSLKDLPALSDASIKGKLDRSKWTAQNVDQIAFSFVSQYAKKSETGKTGLVNLGNTCYMNSVLQALFMSDSFRANVLTTTASLEQSALFKLQFVFAFLLNTQRAAYAPHMFLKACRPPWFAAGYQQDCSEFLKYLLDLLHEQERAKFLKKIEKTQSNDKQSSGAKKEPEPPNPQSLGPTMIQTIFGGQMETTYRCLKCGKESKHREMFTDLPLPFPEKAGSDNGVKNSAAKGGSKALAGGDRESSRKTEKDSEEQENSSHECVKLEDLLNSYLQPERLEGDNQYECEKCKSLQNAERCMKIVQSPDSLILTLLRFYYDGKTHSRGKIFTDVKYPKVISVPVYPDDLTSHKQNAHTVKKSKTGRSPTNSAVKATNGPDCHYDLYCLYSVIIHSGTTSECGHYYTYARHASLADDVDGSSAEDGNRDFFSGSWYIFNDSRVTYANYESFSNVTKRFAKDTAYVLFYKKIQPEGSVLANSLPVDSQDYVLKKHLREAIDADNKLYLQEQELESRSKAARGSSMSSRSSNWKDDNNQGPPGSCGGGGGLGGLDTSGSRFVF